MTLVIWCDIIVKPSKNGVDMLDKFSELCYHEKHSPSDFDGDLGP